MITELSISDLGVIENATLEFSPGFTAVTGETGAGKTMVVTALGLILGARSDQGAVRRGASAARADGRFDVSTIHEVSRTIEDAGGQLDDGELILARKVASDGKSRAYAGGRSVPAGVLTDLGKRLVAVHGQSDQLRLASTSEQRELLDRFIGEAAARAASDYAAIYTERKARRERLDALVADRDSRVAEAARLREALEAIAAVAPTAGEDDELDQRIAVLTHGEELRLSAAEAAAALAADGSVTDSADAIGLVEAARKALERAAAVDEHLGPLAASLAEARYALEDVNTELGRYLDSFDAGGPGDLEEALARRAALRDITRAYGPTIDDVIAFDAAGLNRLIELESDDDTIAVLDAELQEDELRIAAAAEALTEARRRGAERLSEAVTAEVQALAMPGASIHVSVTALDDYSATGRDKVEILLAPHPDADPRPVAKGASGGELSRVMLAIEVVAAQTGDVATYVFDEVDAGVGGAAAIEIGKRLARLSRYSQVIVVTHLAQVAAFADTHVRVLKDASGGYTSSSVRSVSGDERVAELARMLSGLDESETGIAHARELIELARAASAENASS